MIRRQKCFTAAAAIAVLILAIGGSGRAIEEGGASPAALHPDADLAVRLIKVPADLKVDVWAAEPLLVNPVALTFDKKGRAFVAETFRLHAGAMDIRDRWTWAGDAFKKIAAPQRLGHLGDEILHRELAAKTVDDRMALIKEVMDPRAMTANAERVEMVEDSDGNGRADRSKVWAGGFNHPLDGVAAGILARKGGVYLANIPHLWWLEDKNNDGVADVRRSLSDGYGVRFGFTGHDLHGLRIGPDGRLYFSIGDRGAFVRTKSGAIDLSEWGGVFRCNLDGSDVEIFATGLRNPQDLAFDDQGNLFTGDNNADGGDRARFVYVVSGGDSGWRVGYQFLEEPVSRGPWNSEAMWRPQGNGQPAFLVPPVKNITEGPAGLAFYPGTGLPDRFAGHFFLVDFRGQSSSSGVQTFTVRPKGAGFELMNPERTIWGVLATDVEFGPDGALYISDWVQGWPKPDKGRIYKVHDPQAAKNPLVAGTRALLASDLKRLDDRKLGSLLGHPDGRVRQEAQFQLVQNRATGVLLAAATDKRSGIARLHAIWGLGQLVRNRPASAGLGEALTDLLGDGNADVRAQAANVLGDARVASAHDALVQLLGDPQPRVRFFAALAIGRVGRATDVPAVMNVLRRDDAEGDAGDPYLRHAGVMALTGIGNVPALVAATADPSPGARMGALLALRRLRRPEISGFLADARPEIVLEAARAINDLPIEDAMPALAALEPKRLDVATAVRIINANFRQGTPEAAARVAALAGSVKAPADARREALSALGSWSAPSSTDRVTGLWRPLPEHRNADVPKVALQTVLHDILAKAPDPVRTSALFTAGRLRLKEAAPQIASLVRAYDAAPSVRLEALEALAKFEAAELAAASAVAARDPSERIRLAALRVILKIDHAHAPARLAEVMAKGTVRERQVALASLPSIDEGARVDLLSRALDDLLANKVPLGVRLDLIEAADKAGAPVLKEKLAKYEAARPRDELGPYREALEGGDSKNGSEIFVNRLDVSCVRCHRIGDYGGEAGPDLSTIGQKRDRAYLLESVVLPSSRFAEGFESVVVTLKDGSIHGGVVKSETADRIDLLTPDLTVDSIKKDAVKTRERGASGMPDGFGQILSKRDLRDLIEFLANKR